MDDINIWADNPMWDNEVSSGIYLRPLQLSAKVAYEQGKKLTENIQKMNYTGCLIIYVRKVHHHIVRLSKMLLIFLCWMEQKFWHPQVV